MVEPPNSNHLAKYFSRKFNNNTLEKLTSAVLMPQLGKIFHPNSPKTYPNNGFGYGGVKAPVERVCTCGGLTSRGDALLRSLNLGPDG